MTVPTTTREFWLETDEAGIILDTAEDACVVLGVRPRHARGRSLPMMFADGGPTVTELQQAMRGRFVDRQAMIFSRGQPIRVLYHIELRISKKSENRFVLRWTFERL